MWEVFKIAKQYRKILGQKLDFYNKGIKFIYFWFLI